MPLSLTESQAVTDLAGFLYDFLPGKPHPYADQTISFAGVAHSLGIAECWIGGSKLPAITALLERTLETRRDCFCLLIVGIVRKGIAYRHKRGNAITREEIRQLNDLVALAAVHTATDEHPRVDGWMITRLFVGVHFRCPMAVFQSDGRTNIQRSVSSPLAT